MRKNDRIRLQHMLDAAKECMECARKRSRSELDTDRKLALALVKGIEIIGEAAYQVSDETRDKLSEIPWEDIIAMRHRLVHAYFDINLDILWQTVQQDLPLLINMLERALETLNH